MCDVGGGAVKKVVVRGRFEWSTINRVQHPFIGNRECSLCNHKDQSVIPVKRFSQRCIFADRDIEKLIGIRDEVDCREIVDIVPLLGAAITVGQRKDSRNNKA